MNFPFRKCKLSNTVFLADPCYAGEGDICFEIAYQKLGRAISKMRVWWKCGRQRGAGTTK
jgi:hypothetical protein